ncbi:MAG: hypothetical protein KC413_25305, partial [Anaerolineales bacterium]|nr:hypothetical protein [Anaerolineales bacterium]
LCAHFHHSYIGKFIVNAIVEKIETGVKQLFAACYVLAISLSLTHRRVNLPGGTHEKDIAHTSQSG